jgi:TonB-dependent SusC/RagA subfamily outer membrane receptor
VALPWLLPLHWLSRRLRLAVELDCDARVVAHGAQPRAYGSLLIDMAGRTSALPFAAALADRPSELEQRIRALGRRGPRLRHLRAGVAACAVALLVAAAGRLDFIGGVAVAAVPQHTAAATPQLRPAAGSIAGVERHAGALEPAAPPVVAAPLPSEAAGAPVAPSDAAPARGAQSHISVRVASARGPTSAPSPLIYVDGVILEDPRGLQQVSPEEIESIEVLKGPAAEALYGPGARGGVIRVATKS